MRLTSEVEAVCNFINKHDLRHGFNISDAMLADNDLKLIERECIGLCDLNELNKQDLQQIMIDSNELAAKIIGEKIGIINQRLYWSELSQYQTKVEYTWQQVLTHATNNAKHICEQQGRTFQVTDDILTLWPRLARYFAGAEKREGDFDTSKGILLAGSVGVGKTLTMQCFSENPKQSYTVEHINSVVRDFEINGGSAIESYINLRRRFVPSVYGHRENSYCFDDIGSEREGRHFGGQRNVFQEVLTEIVNKYDLRKNTHGTSNLDSAGLQKAYEKRGYDRIRECFNVYIFQGHNSLR